MGPPWGTWGPYLRMPSVEYYLNAFFWTSLSTVTPTSGFSHGSDQKTNFRSAGVWGGRKPSIKEAR